MPFESLPIELLLGQSIKITNWLTPVWILSCGISLGFLMVLVTLIKVWAMSKIPGLNKIGESGSTRITAGIVLGLVYLALAVAGYYFAYEPAGLDESFGLFLVFVIPLAFMLGYGVWGMFTERGFSEVFSLFREGFLRWVNFVCLAAVLFAITGFILAPFSGFGVVEFVDKPEDIMNSLGRIHKSGTFSGSLTVEPSGDEDVGKKIDVEFWGQETRWLRFQSNQELEIATEPIDETLSPHRVFKVSASSAKEAQQFYRRADGKGRIPNEKIESLYVVNRGRGPATFSYKYKIAPVYEQVWIIPWAAAYVVGLYLFYWVAALLFPKVFAIAYSTFKSEINQPLFLVILLIGVVFVVMSIYVPYNTFGEDIKMYKDSGLTLIRVLAIFLAIWAASKSVAAEIEGRTALTVLSKPVGRRQFIFGKFTGIALAIGLMFIVLGLWFFTWVSYKPIYDFAEASKGLCEWPECFLESTHIAPGIFLCFLEVLIFVAISVAISTRMGVLANFLICFSIYVLGHLTPLLVQSSMAEFQPIVVFGQLIAIVFPVLNHYDVQAAINTNSPVPLDYIGWSIIYTAIYGTVAMLLALVLFEDRDLA